MLPVLAATMIAGGIYGALTAKKPKYDMGAMDEALKLINKQYTNINDYFSEANTAFEGQYRTHYSQEMQDAINSIAGSGIFESPVSQNMINRKQTALGEQYATAKSQLAGQKMQATSAIDQQKISYYQTLAGVQYQQSLANQQQKQAIFGAMGSVGGALLGA